MKKKYIFLLFILIIFIGFYYILNINYHIENEVIIDEGEGLNKITYYIDGIEKLSFYINYKFFLEQNVNVYKGVYNLGGTYSFKELISKLENGPEKNYIELTIIEGWSKYDIDTYLKQKGVINEGEYIKYIDNEKNIKKYKKKFDFLKNVKKDINSLEGFLYPETYNIDISGDVLSQLVELQLEAFNNNVWNNYGKEILNFNKKLSNNGYSFGLSLYDIIILSSIIEKEVRLNKNKNIIAGILLNRLENNSILGADISLCYGLKISYQKCDPEKISENIYDKNNPYNTRKKLGLPPTPISNVSRSTLQNFLDFKLTDNLYYLHDKDGNLHTSKTIQEHNLKKSKYLGR